ncbi:MAG TPA: hypothetical protein VMW75_16845 [Thermoanaerobaculia bacterium]|nr:hypothetical protein [Thermoanaerobaculia bacterium]
MAGSQSQRSTGREIAAGLAARLAVGRPLPTGVWDAGGGEPNAAYGSAPP